MALTDTFVRQVKHAGAPGGESTLMGRGFTSW